MTRAHARWQADARVATMDAAAVGGWLGAVGLGGLTAQFADAVCAPTARAAVGRVSLAHPLCQLRESVVLLRWPCALALARAPLALVLIPLCRCSGCLVVPRTAPREPCLKQRCRALRAGGGRQGAARAPGAGLAPFSRRTILLYGGLHGGLYGRVV